MENIFSFLSRWDSSHMSARFLLKPFAFLFGHSVFIVSPQKTLISLWEAQAVLGKCITTTVYPGHASVFFYSFPPVMSMLQCPEVLLHCSSSISHLLDVVLFSLSCSQGLKSRAVLLMLSSTADLGLALGCKCGNTRTCVGALLIKLIPIAQPIETIVQNL